MKLLHKTFSIFKKIKLFKKNQYNLKNNIIMSEIKEDVLKFQWKKGENFGKVVEVKNEDDKFYYFTDGSQIFKNVLSEFLEKVEGNILPFPGADNVLVSGISPKKTTQIQNTPNTIKEKAPENVKSELHGLVEKLSKKHVVSFEPRLNLNAIDPKVFKMLVENADESPENLVKTITEVAMSQIEINKLREYLQEEITNFLNNYYNG
jgi:hypothetical protein